jgi:hypothetical protein
MEATSNGLPDGRTCADACYDGFEVRLVAASSLQDSRRPPRRCAIPALRIVADASSPVTPARHPSLLSRLRASML